MTDEQFASGVDDIIASKAGHAAHRALDMLWTQYAMEKGGLIAAATAKWMAAIEGDHADGKPYPIPHRKEWDASETQRCWALRSGGATYAEIGRTMGRSYASVKARLEHCREQFGPLLHPQKGLPA